MVVFTKLMIKGDYKLNVEVIKKLKAPGRMVDTVLVYSVLKISYSVSIFFTVIPIIHKVAYTQIIQSQTTK